MSESTKALLRSLVITFLTTLALAITASDFAWDKSAIVAAVVAAIRTAVQALIPGGPYGIGGTSGD